MIFLSIALGNPLARNTREVYVRPVELAKLRGWDINAVGADASLAAGSVAFPDAPPILTHKTML